jgi:hypothetical protein
MEHKCHEASEVGDQSQRPRCSHPAKPLAHSCHSEDVSRTPPQFAFAARHRSLPNHHSFNRSLTQHRQSLTTKPYLNMARQRGGVAPRRPTAPAAKPAPVPATQRHASTAAHPPAQPAPPMQQQAQAPTPQGPGLFGQMASTAA